MFSGEIKIPGTNLIFFCTISGENEKNSAKEIPQKSYTKCFDYDIIKSSLCVRYRRPGDYFTIDGEGKKKKLKSYFIDEKIPQEERDRQLLSFREQNQSLQILNSELSGLLNLLPDTEELLSQIEQQKTRIEQLENENQQWQELTQKLNNENSLLQKQNSELLTLNSR